ncbi:MAG: DMT family transporter [Chloroflexi bacterium]|nr:DMT family transporter [Chloroflexota bacterium]
MNRPQESTTRATPLKAYFVILVAIVATSSAAILIRYALDETMPPLMIAASRLAVATVALTPLAIRGYRDQMARLSRAEWLLILISGICLAIHFTAWVSSLQHTTVLVSVVIVSTGPIWVAILEVFFLKIRLSRLVVAGLLTALAGGVLIGIPLGGNALQAAQTAEDLSATATGGILAWIGALSISVYMLIGRKLRATLPVIPYVWLVYGTASVCAVAVMIATQTPAIGFRAQGYLILLAMGLIPQLVGHSSLNYLLEYFPAAIVSMFSQLEPIGSAILALALFRELPPDQQIAGSVIIIIGVILASRGEIRQMEHGKQDEA